jgi:hypothetical protein
MKLDPVAMDRSALGGELRLNQNIFQIRGGLQLIGLKNNDAPSGRIFANFSHCCFKAGHKYCFDRSTKWSNGCSNEIVWRGECGRIHSGCPSKIARCPESKYSPVPQKGALGLVPMLLVLDVVLPPRPFSGAGTSEPPTNLLSSIQPSASWQPSPSLAEDEGRGRLTQKDCRRLLPVS